MTKNQQPVATAEIETAPPLVYSVRARATGLASTDELLAALTDRVPDASIFEQHPPVFMRATASNRNLDAYYSRMSESTLQNFATDAADGVSFLNSHNMRSLGFGQTFAGRYMAGGQMRTDVDLYVLRGLKLNETANDDFIAAVAGGSIKDVSVGFIPGWYRCGICDQRMLNFMGMVIPECGHWPGEEYPVSDKDPSKGMRTAFAWVEDARLSELSAVNDGATPGAQITSIRARQLIADGQLPREAAERIASHFDIDVPIVRAFSGAEVPPAKEAEPMEFTPEQIAQIRLALTETGAAPDADIPTTIRTVVDEVAALRALKPEVERLKPIEAECARLRPLADLGTQYRADLIEEAIKEGNRAEGVGFLEETYRGLFEHAQLESIKAFRERWQKAGNGLFPGGRLTQETTEHTNGKAAAGDVPDAAFRTR